MKRRVTIVGGGAAGAMTALAFLRRDHDGEILLLERTGEPGRGVAYSAPHPWHRLNVHAFRTGGAVDGEERGFAAWLESRHGIAEADTLFAPRQLFGAFLGARLDEAASDPRLRIVRADATGIRRSGDRWTVETGEGDAIASDAAMLCTGHLPPAGPLPDSPLVIRDMWDGDALASVPPDARVLVVGSGSTAIDAFLHLRRTGRSGPVTFVSRRGLLPFVEAPPASYPLSVDMSGPNRSPARLSRFLRREIRDAAGAGTPWQTVFDAFRAHAQTVWGGLSDTERRRFLRHARSHWMAHRHRLPPDVADAVRAERRSGRLAVLAGRIVSVRADEVVELTLRERGGPVRTLVADVAIDCTGPSFAYDRSPEPLWRSLFAAGLCRPDPLGLGLDVDAQSRLVDQDGRSLPGLYAIGSATRGRFWEITAIPHIRTMATRVADMVAAEFASCGSASGRVRTGQGGA